MLITLSIFKKTLNWIMILSVLYLSYVGVQFLITRIQSAADFNFSKEIKTVYILFIIFTITMLVFMKIIFKKIRVSSDSFLFTFSTLAIFALAFVGNDVAASIVLLAYIIISALITLFEKIYLRKKLIGPDSTYSEQLMGRRVISVTTRASAPMGGQAIKVSNMSSEESKD